MSKPWTTGRKIRLATCVLVLFACSPGGDDEEEDPTSTGSSETTQTEDGRHQEIETYTRDFTVDCLGMSVTSIEGTAYGTTRTPLVGDLTVSEAAMAAAYGGVHPVSTVPRCGYWFEPPFEAGPVTPLTLATFTFNTSATGMLKIAYDGQMWTPYFGDINLDGQPGNTKAEGHYDAIFTNGSELARIRGQFSWCEPALHPDCSNGVTDDLPYDFEVQMPARAFENSDPTFGWGTASDCRVLIDPATGGMQLDLQVAFWKGASVTQLYTGYCDNTTPDVMNFNQLTFRTGGVTGPGSYGPWAVHNYGDVVLPELTFDTPFSFLYAGVPLAPAGFCALSQGGFAHGTARTQPNSTCELDLAQGVGDEPGEVRLICTDVDHHYQGGEFNNDAVGTFDLWARCDISTR